MLLKYLKKELIEIEKYIYDDLVNDQKFLRALNAAGVDNWQGYDYAVELWEKEKSDSINRQNK